MKNRVPLPPELEATKAAARRAIGAIRPAQVSTSDQAKNRSRPCAAAVLSCLFFSLGIAGVPFLGAV